jgi:hypothetical protein
VADGQGSTEENNDVAETREVGSTLTREMGLVAVEKCGLEPEMLSHIRHHQ